MKSSRRFALVAGFGLVAATLSSVPAAAAPKPKPPAFGMCGVCHKTTAGEKSVLGPNLWGVGDRKAGTLPGYAYSPAMKKANFAWNRDQLIRFITDPHKVVRGTKMAYAGQKNPKLASDIADYLLSLK